MSNWRRGWLEARPLVQRSLACDGLCYAPGDCLRPSTRQGSSKGLSGWCGSRWRMQRGSHPASRQRLPPGSLRSLRGAHSRDNVNPDSSLIVPVLGAVRSSFPAARRPLNWRALRRAHTQHHDSINNHSELAGQGTTASQSTHDTRHTPRSYSYASMGQAGSASLAWSCPSCEEKVAHD
ncbi:hypothetical protein BD289DRAFT_289304 [Coniella lustricola]|uniref:Uncharacterized protein n=1 Tax=Coniella lustricola TaxID=2025994 RepID=A0A2T3A5B9_9PEZI|nr:hypothetical protein BD289DRAFT_289304 [Coniella lustricola]